MFKKSISLLLCITFITTLFILPVEAKDTGISNVLFYSDYEELDLINMFLEDISEYDFSKRLQQHLLANKIDATTVTVGMPFKVDYKDDDGLRFYYFPIYNGDEIVTYVQYGDLVGTFTNTGLGLFLDIDLEAFNQGEVYYAYANIDDSVYAMNDNDVVLISTSPNGSSYAAPMHLVSVLDSLETNYVDITERFLSIDLKPIKTRDGAWLWAYEGVD